VRRAAAAAAALALAACTASMGTAPATKVPARAAVDPASLVQYPSVTFLEGLDAGAQGPNGSNWWVNELPLHPVSLTGFSLDVDEVSVAKYATFLAWQGGLGHYSPLMPIVVGPTSADFTPVPGTENEPIAEVTWFDARAFCLWMGGALPTEAQWEFAAKGPDARLYPWDPDAGNGPTCALATYATGDVNCTETPADAGSYPAGDTPEGLHDMAGNVAEWTADVYGWYPNYSPDAGVLPGAWPTLQDPAGPDAGPVYVNGSGYGTQGATLRVVRGGGFHDLGISLRTTARWGADADLRSPGVGFRCAYPAR
jgi:formylglycine-generating enzyme required for sulfatase activity